MRTWTNKATFASALVVLVMVLGPRAWAQCAPQWSAAFAPQGVNNSVNSVATFDEDGAGPAIPALFVGGDFTAAGGQTIRGLARWNGVVFSPVGTGLDGSVYAMLVWDDDGPGPHQPALYVGGNFTTAGGTPAPGIAKWSGSSWSPVGNGVTGGAVRALAAYDADGAGPNLPALFVGGDFTAAGGAAASRIARWDGSAWATLTTGTTSSVLGMTAFDPDGAGPAGAVLVVGGSFTTAGGAARSRVATWNGGAWGNLGSGFNFTVNALATFDEDGAGPNPPVLYAAGGFSMSGTTNVQGVARWTGTQWAQLSPYPPSFGIGTISSLLAFDPDGPGPLPEALFIGGGFSQSGGGTDFRDLASWSGTGWTTLAGGGTANSVYAMCPYDEDGDGPMPPHLAVGGLFINAGLNVFQPMSRVGIWNGAGWNSLGQGVNDTVFALAVHDADGDGPNPPALYAAGNFTNAGPQIALRIGRWDGSQWARLGNGFDFNPAALASFDEDGPGPNPPRLFAGGNFNTAGGNPIPGLARWDGSAWTQVGPAAMSGYALSFTTWDDDGPGPHLPALIVGGFFSVSGCNRLARWDGASWSAFGNQIGGNGAVRALAVYDEDGNGPLQGTLYAAGDFTDFGPDAIDTIVKWNGSSWSPLGERFDFNSVIRALAVFDEDGSGPLPPVLIAAGTFSLPGIADNIARWDGHAWTPVGGGLDGGVSSMLVFDDDGAGPHPPSLAVSGSFSHAGGAPMAGLVRWDGSSWSAIAAPSINGSASAMVVFDDDSAGPRPPALYMGGVFTTAGGLQSPRLARLGADQGLVFTSSPESVAVAEGSPAHFSVAASGTAPITYQWRREGTPLSATGVFSGVQGPTLSISAASAAVTGTYDALVTNPCGTFTTAPAALAIASTCGSADFNQDGEVATDADIEAFFACLAGDCCSSCGSADFNGDGDVATDADIEAFFRVLAGGSC